MTTSWSSAYPVSIDAYVPLVDNVDQVIANHNNTLSKAIMALESKIGITNGIATGFGGLSFSPIGHATFPGVLGNPTVWIDNSFSPGHLIFTNSGGTDFDVLNNHWTATGTVLSPSIANNTTSVTSATASGISAVEGIASGSGAYANIGGNFSAAGTTGIGVKGYSTGSTGYGVYGQTTQNTGYSGYFTGGKFTATGYGDIVLTSSNGNIGLNDQHLTVAINVSETGVAALVGYTATSLVGALNEVKSGVTTAYVWSRAATTLSPLTANDKVSVTSADASGISVIAGIASGAGAYANIGGDFSAAGSTGIGVKGYSTGATGYGVYGQTTQNTGYSGYFTGGKFTATGYGDIALTSSDGEISLNDKWLTSAINLSQTGTTGLVGFTATSIMAALNEVRAVVAGDVFGPASSTDHAVARFDLATGKLLQNSVVTISDGGILSLPVTTAVTGGMISFGSDRFAHIYKEATRDGQNTFVGILSGNFTVGTLGINVYNGSGNTAVGYDTLSGLTSGYYNTAMGVSSLKATTTGPGNSAFGYNALIKNVGGVYNCAFGAFAGNENVGGNWNSVFGYEAFKANVSGTNNCAFGYQALYTNTSDFNTAIGAQALLTNLSGSRNTAVGSLALGLNSTGISNTAVGVHALYASLGHGNSALGDMALRYSTGGYNTACGYHALYTNVSGSNNTAIGSEAGSANLGSGSVFVGYRAGYWETLSNKLFIDYAERAGEADGRAKALVYGIFDAAVANQYFTINGTATATQGLVLGFDATTPTVNTAGYLKMFSAGDTAFYTTFTAGIQTANATYTLPTAMPTVSGQVLASTDIGVMSWGTAPVPTTITVQDTAATGCYVGLFESATGNLAPKTDGALLYNASTGALSTTSAVIPTVAGSTVTANNLTIRANTFDTTTGQVNVTTSLEASSTTVAALTSAGGLGVAKRTWTTDLTVANLPTLGGTPLTTTVAILNYLTSATGTTGTNTTNIVFSTSPVLTTPTVTTSINPSANDGATLGISGTAFSDLYLALGAVINYNAGASTITHSANTLTVGGSGATTLALGSNNLTMTGSIADTGSRVTKGWFADLESTAGIVLGFDATPATPNTAGYLKMFSAGDNAFYTTFTAGTQTANATYTLPTAPPTVDGQSLTSTTAGVMSWGTIIGGDSEDGMAVYKNIFNDFTAVYKDADEIELVGLPFNITAVQIKKITRKPTGTAVSVVKNRGVDLVCIWTVDGSIAGKGSITTTSLGTLASTDEYIVEVEGEPKGYMASTDSNKSYVVNDVMAINDGLIADVTADDVTITKSLLVDGFNAISIDVTLGDVGDFVKVLGSNDPSGAGTYYDITALACGVPLIVTSGAYQTSSVIMFPYIQIVVDGNVDSASAYLTRFLKK